MKEVTQYVAFDGTVFPIKQECLDYEESGYIQEIENVHIRMQQLKGGEMKQVHKNYLKARAAYREVCNNRVDPQTRVNATIRYYGAKETLDKTIVAYQRLRNRYNFLKDRAAATNKEEQ